MLTGSAGVATLTAGTTRTTATARAATGTTRATARTTTTTRTAILARRRRQLPADARARHLSATRTIILFRSLGLRADLQATEAARLVAIATTAAEATGPAGTTATAALATAAALAATATAVTATLFTARLRRRDAIDHVVELAARDRAMRTGLALEHAHEANLVDAIADDVERLEHARRAIGLHAELVRDEIDRRIGRSVGLRRLTTLGGLRGLGRLLAFGGLLTFGRLLTFRGGSRLGRGRLGRRRRGLGARGLRARCGRISQDQRGELGERLHGG
jgi:hypothetical protein